MNFFCFITSLTIYVHLITISHLRQFPSVVWISLYLFIYWFFFSGYLFRVLTSGVYVPHLHLLFMWISGWLFTSLHCKMLILSNFLKASYAILWASYDGTHRKNAGLSSLGLVKTLPTISLITQRPPTSTVLLCTLRRQTGSKFSFHWYSWNCSAVDDGSTS